MQMVFLYYHKRVSEADLMRELRTNEEVGTTPSWMIRIARKYGFFSYVNNDSSIEEIRYFLRIGKPVIVYFVEPSEEDDHFAVVSGFGRRNIIFNDSWNGKGFSMNLRTFDKRWHGEKKYHKSLRRWMLVLSLDEIPMGRQYKPFPDIIKSLI